MLKELLPIMTSRFPLLQLSTEVITRVEFDVCTHVVSEDLKHTDTHTHTGNEVRYGTVRNGFRTPTFKKTCYQIPYFTKKSHALFRIVFFLKI